MNCILKKIFLAILLIFLVWTATVMRPFGEPEQTQMDDYFLENGQEETGSNNIVSSIVFDYRGLDTLGEATVLFTAVTGIVLLFREAKK